MLLVVFNGCTCTCLVTMLWGECCALHACRTHLLTQFMQELTARFNKSSFCMYVCVWKEHFIQFNIPWLFCRFVSVCVCVCDRSISVSLIFHGFPVDFYLYVCVCVCGRSSLTPWVHVYMHTCVVLFSLSLSHTHTWTHSGWSSWIVKHLITTTLSTTKSRILCTCRSMQCLRNIL